jgi:ATP-dependent protease ClpP protease subunit
MSESFVNVNGRLHPVTGVLGYGQIMVGPAVEPAAAPQRININLVGPILDDDETGDGFRASEIVPRIQKAPQECEFHLWINCVGGNFQATRRIIDALSARRELKVAHIDGVAYSGGFLLALAADEREMTERSRLMTHAVHRAGCIDRTTAETEWCCVFIHRRCPSIPLTRARAWLNRNNSDGDGVWLDAPMAVRLGIITTVLLDEKGPAKVPDALRPFARKHESNFGQCQCAECQRARAGRAESKPVDVPMPQAIAGGFIIASVDDLKPRPVSGPQDAVREALRRECADRWAEHQSKRLRNALAEV